MCNGPVWSLRLASVLQAQELLAYSNFVFDDFASKNVNKSIRVLIDISHLNWYAQTRPGIKPQAPGERLTVPAVWRFATRPLPADHLGCVWLP